VQSLPVLHFFPAAQPAQSAPPQSTSVSVPSFVRSEQLAGPVQTEETQLPLAQSEDMMHLRPTAHGAQLPPQSKSVSFGSLSPLEQYEEKAERSDGASIGSMGVRSTGPSAEPSDPSTTAASVPVGSNSSLWPAHPSNTTGRIATRPRSTAACAIAGESRFGLEVGSKEFFFRNSADRRPTIPVGGLCGPPSSNWLAVIEKDP
jgi:hypothetical protein